MKILDLIDKALEKRGVPKVIVIERAMELDLICAIYQCTEETALENNLDIEEYQGIEIAFSVKPGIRIY